MPQDIRPVGSLESVAICWGVAALVGFASMVLLYFFADWMAIQAIFMGGVIGCVLAAVLMLTVGRSTPKAGEGAQRKAANAAAAAAAPSLRPAAHNRHVPAPSPHRTSIPFSAISDTQGPNLNDASVNHGYGADGSTAAGPVNAAKPAAKAKPAPLEGNPPPIGDAVVTTAKAPAIGSAVLKEAQADTAPAPVEPEAAKAEPAKPAAKKAAKPKAAPKPKAEAKPKEGAKPKAEAKPKAAEAPADPGAGTEPARLKGPRDGGADDLKRIKGVGPKLEGVLNDMGFYHFDQVGSWSADEVAWADQNLVGFKGRVSRDNWVDQAKLLAEGKETEFSKKVDKGGVY